MLKSCSFCSSFSLFLSIYAVFSKSLAKLKELEVPTENFCEVLQKLMLFSKENIEPDLRNSVFFEFLRQEDLNNLSWGYFMRKLAESLKTNKNLYEMKMKGFIEEIDSLKEEVSNLQEEKTCCEINFEEETLKIQLVQELKKYQEKVKLFL